MGTAKSPLPRNTTRVGRRHADGCQLLVVVLVVRVELGDRDDPLARRQVVDVQLALEVVVLVLDGARQQARARRP